MPKLRKTNIYQSFQLSLGGTIGYLITKSGAQKLLDFISEHGATNCIDTLQQKSANILNVYYCNPQLVYSECFRNENKNIDTDIQNNHASLSLSFETKVEEELKFYKDNNLNIVKLHFEEVKNKILYIFFCLKYNLKIKYYKSPEKNFLFTQTKTLMILKNYVKKSL